MVLVRSAGAAVVLALALSACGSEPRFVPPGPAVEAQGSTEYFFTLLGKTDALADYYIQPMSLADLLPNRTVRILPLKSSDPEAEVDSFRWSDRVVLGNVTRVRNADRNRRLQLTIEIAETFPASAARTLEIELPNFPEYADKYLISASSLGRVVLGISDDTGAPRVAFTHQFFGVVDDQDRITWPVLGTYDFERPDWDRNMTTLDGLRAEAGADSTTRTHSLR